MSSFENSRVDDRQVYPAFITYNVLVITLTLHVEIKHNYYGILSHTATDSKIKAANQNKFQNSTTLCAEPF